MISQVHGVLARSPLAAACPRLSPSRLRPHASHRSNGQAETGVHATRGEPAAPAASRDSTLLALPAGDRKLAQPAHTLESPW